MLGSLMGEEEDGNDQVSHPNEKDNILLAVIQKLIDLFVNTPMCFKFLFRMQSKKLSWRRIRTFLF
jgi:hypothetical protein